MPARVKICGVSTPAALDAAIRASADYVGLNFYPPSPRYVSAQVAAGLAARAAKHIPMVGVFVDADDDFLADAITAGQLDAIQLHGHEPPERAAQVRSRFGLPVWKVLSVAGPEDIASAASYRATADFLLFDAKTPAGSALPGGMGLTFDWGLLAAYKGPLPWGLAGGVTPANVADAIAMTGAPMVDVSSGVESAPGIKDVDKIVAFCKAAQHI